MDTFNTAFAKYREMKTPENEKKRRTRFSRAVLPPEKYHSTRKGLRGYSRAEEKREALEELNGFEEAEERDS